MKTASIISYIVAGVIIFFSVLIAWSAFAPDVPDTRLIVGVLGLAIGFAFIYAGARFGAKAKKQDLANQPVNINIDLPGQIQLDSIKCQSCGAPLNANDISVANGAAVVKCHNCATTYQLTEEPKW